MINLSGALTALNQCLQDNNIKMFGPVTDMYLIYDTSKHVIIEFIAQCITLHTCTRAVYRLLFKI